VALLRLHQDVAFRTAYLTVGTAEEAEDVAFAPDGALVFSQTAPEPAVRRVDPESGRVATLVR